MKNVLLAAVLAAVTGFSLAGETDRGTFMDAAFSYVPLVISVATGLVVVLAVLVIRNPAGVIATRFDLFQTKDWLELERNADSYSAVEFRKRLGRLNKRELLHIRISIFGVALIVFVAVLRCIGVITPPSF